MKVTRLTAQEVHGYLSIDVSFFEDLTFLTGLNGSGKTTALRLLMGLLTPALDELASIEFKEAQVEIGTASEITTIKATRDGGALLLSVSSVNDILQLDPAHLELLTEPRRRDEMRTPLLRMLQESQVYRCVRDMATPMFLGLERRLYTEDRLGLEEDYVRESRRRELMQRRMIFEEAEPFAGAVGAGLFEVGMLVRDAMSEIRARQERLDRDLREKLILSAVRFKPSEFESMVVPDRNTLERYRKAQREVERAASLLRLPVEDVRRSLQDFFDNMSALLESMENEFEKRSRSKGGVSKPTGPNALMNWLINRSQIDRILENLEEFERYGQAREALHSPIDRLLQLINMFLAQTCKLVEVSDRDRLSVRIKDGSPRSISALSSGERQIVVMLGHLALNKRLSGSGVFIVDEPELSLHLSWQEMFVEAVREANPEVQLIFATHSPAIILDRTDRCCSLSE